MTKKYSTQKALVASLLSLVLCFSMLIGTTFAWFTDSVISANNIIKSGNLDVELEYWNGTAWVDVSGKSDILTNELWEPGVTEVAYLRIANAGTLALKYMLGINVVSETAGVNVAGDPFNLSDYIKFGVAAVEVDQNKAPKAYATREAAVAALTNERDISAGYTKADALYPANNVPTDIEGAASEIYLALVVYMPTSVGNEANHNGTDVPQIDLGINIVATQVGMEADSFGSDYDADAEHETVSYELSVPAEVPEIAEYLHVYFTPAASESVVYSRAPFTPKSNQIDLGYHKIQHDDNGNRFVEIEYDAFGTFTLVETEIEGNGVWGGIDWVLFADGTLLIAPTTGTPVPDKNAASRTYEVGEWREAVVYKSNGSASAIGGYPYNVNAVTRLVIEEGVTCIGSFSAQFPNLTGEVVIPSTVTYIGQEAFHKTPITKLTFAAGGTAPLCIANGAFKKLLISEIALPGDREYIHVHHWAFGGCANLTTAYIPDNITKMWGGEHVDYFDNFNSQTNVTWANYGSMFTGCTKMESIIFENEAARDAFVAGRQNSAEDYIVAYAGLVGYNSLEKAFAAAKDGDTVGIIRSLNLTAEIAVPTDVSLTLNLHGNKLTLNGEDYSFPANITVNK